MQYQSKRSVQFLREDESQTKRRNGFSASKCFGVGRLLEELAASTNIYKYLQVF